MDSLKMAVSLRDKLRLCYDRAVLYLFRVIPIDPTGIMKDFTVRNRYGIFACPGSYPADVLLHEDYESSISNLVKEFRNGVFVDVGASIGNYAIMSSKSLADRGSVLALEPNSITYRYLRLNVECNECRNVKALRFAAWSNPGPLMLFLGKFGRTTPLQSSLLNNSAASHASTRFETVQGVRLDSLIPKGVPVLIKLDIEGAEANALTGSLEILEKGNVQV